MSPGALRTPVEAGPALGPRATREGFSDLGLRPEPSRAWPYLGVALLGPLVAMPLAVAAATLVGAPDRLTWAASTC